MVQSLQQGCPQYMTQFERVTEVVVYQIQRSPCVNTHITSPIKIKSSSKMINLYTVPIRLNHEQLLEKINGYTNLINMSG